MRRILPSATAETASSASMCVLLGEAADAYVASDSDPAVAGPRRKLLAPVLLHLTGPPACRQLLQLCETLRV